MSYSKVITFDDRDRYQATLRGGDYEVLINCAGGFKAELTRIDLEHLWTQSGRSETPAIIHGGLDPNRAAVLFRYDADQAPMHHNGVDLSPEEIVFHSRGDTIYNWSPGPSYWRAMSMPHDQLAAAGRAILGHELGAPPTTYVARPSPGPMTYLRAVHNAACELARTDPSAFSHPATVKALEQELVHALVVCLAKPMSAAAKVDAGHAKIVRRFEDFLASREHEPIYVAEICAAIGVSEGTLRNCCREQLGMSPIHFLWLRRMHLARRALLAADAGSRAVTNVATEYGFWELGRFSVQYRTLFGESPSKTLKRSPVAFRH